jgi:hypothetical protein
MLKRLFADVGATLHAHDASGQRDVFQSRLVFPLLHFRIRAKRRVDLFRQRKKFHAAVHAFGVFSKHDLINWNVFAARVRDLVATIIERIARITLTRPHVGVEIEHLTQADDRRKIYQPFSLQFRRQFFFGFGLRFARDRAEETARGFFQCFYGAVGQCIAFLAPKFPTNLARHIFGIEFQPIQNKARGLHNIVPNSVTWHPCNSVFSHRKATL